MELEEVVKEIDLFENKCIISPRPKVADGLHIPRCGRRCVVELFLQKIMNSHIHQVLSKKLGIFHICVTVFFFVKMF